MSAAENVEWSFIGGQHIPSCAAGALVVVSVCVSASAKARRIRVSQETTDGSDAGAPVVFSCDYSDGHFTRGGRVIKTIECSVRE